jgi:hypothetical protein
LPAAGAAFAQDATKVGPVVTVLQVVVVQLFPELADALLHDATPVGPDATIGQVVLT